MLIKDRNKKQKWPINIRKLTTNTSKDVRERNPTDGHGPPSLPTGSASPWKEIAPTMEGENGLMQSCSLHIGMLWNSHVTCTHTSK